MSWRLWEMLPLEALRIDHISWSFVLSATWDQTLSHLASPWNHSLHFRYFQRRRGLLQVAAFKALKMDEVSQHKEKQRERQKDTIFLWNIWKLKRLFQNFSHNLQLFHIVSSFVAEICKWGGVLVAQFSSFTTCLHTSHCHTIVQMLIINLFFSKLSFTKPDTSIGSVQVAGSIAVSSLQRAKHWLHAVALQGAPKIVREIASMTSVWICLVRLFELSHTNKVTWFYSLLSMSLVRRYP